MLQESELINKIAQRKCILLIGSEVILNEDKIGYANDITLLEYLLEKYRSYLLKKRITHYRAQVETIFNIDELSPKLEDINPDLIKLMDSKCFPVVITTSTTPYMRILMEHVWGKEKLKVYSIFDSTNKSKIDFSYGKAVLFYAFGSTERNVGTNLVKFGKLDEEEDNMMAALTRWINIETRPSIDSFLKNEDTYIMSIGCTFDNWYFRFLWYTLRGGMHDRYNSLMDKGQVALTYNENEKDEKLTDYLYNIGVHYNKDNYNSVDSLKVFAEFMTPPSLDNPKNSNLSRIKQIIDGNKIGKVFISYSHEDFFWAEQLYYHLKEAGIEVWMDTERLVHECVEGGYLT